MIDFVTAGIREVKKGKEVYPMFIVKKSSDLMTRGKDFYAIWVEDRGVWSTDEQDVIKLVDKVLDQAGEDIEKSGEHAIVKHMWDASSGSIDAWLKYCQKQSRENYVPLDEKLTFANDPINKKDYASKRLPYPLEPGDMSAYDELMGVLYSPEERQKIEWAIGAIVSGDSKKIQKFMVLYGAGGTGKSTVLNIIQKLFDGYYSVFDAKALGSSNNSFALEPFKNNPLVAIQHDGDLSHIEDNTRLNSLVSHEEMTVNEKFKSLYTTNFNAFIFMGTNKPVKITDAKSGLIRRLIDVSPTGNKIENKRYKALVKKIDFELGAIAYHCLEVYRSNPNRYDNYIPTNMMGASNDFYNFVMSYYYIFKEKDGTTLNVAWEMYKTYCEEAKVYNQYSQRVFKEELKNYFKDFKTRYGQEGEKNVYSGFRADKFFGETDDLKEEPISDKRLLVLDKEKSILDDILKDCPSQYANLNGTPNYKWDDVKTKLSDIDTTKLHYVKVPKNHIVIDFDLKNEKGEKDRERNLEEACKWPSTYAEFSKSGSGVHLHYLYDGDASTLSRVYDENIEIKVFNGNSSLRRMLTKCNDIPIATINSGLPIKGEKMLNDVSLKSEKSLRIMIMRNLNKEFHGATKPSVDFIFKILEDAYNNGLKYDVSDMYNQIFAFAAGSSHQADYCIKLVGKMKFKSDEPSANIDNSDEQIIFYDVEVFPNLFLVNWKFRGSDSVVRMINPTSEEIEELTRFKLIGFNNRRYDNHILYARILGYSNEQLYELSQKIVNGEPNCFFGEAYNLSYADIYDFSTKKQSLKKFEIDLGIHHQELGLPWDQPVPEELWERVAEYCDNDVIATEAAFEDRAADFTARQILADVAGMTVNDTTNSLTTRIIFGKNRSPQSSFNYRDMGDTNQVLYKSTIDGMVLYNNFGDEYTLFDEQCRPVFPGYRYDRGVSTYRGEEVGEGGYVYSEPGMYRNVALLDIASMHPSSIVAEKLFGDEYTAKFKEIMDARIAVKHKEFDRAKNMLGGKLAKYLSDPQSADALAKALKIPINSVYGLTSASFDNPFRDKRNKDNIVAKRGALFMINLKHEVQKRGFTVAHIKTDSIKVPDATPEIIEFIMDYGRMYGYNFEHEATYDRMCLVNDAVYIAKYREDQHNGEWTATGTQFQIPYVFKTLFSKEPIEFSDLCETKSVKSALYLDMNERLDNVEDVEFVKSLRSNFSPNAIEILDYTNWLSGIQTSHKNKDILERWKDVTDEELDEMIAKGHEYVFIGKVGLFCPVRKGCGGGILYREQNGKYYAVTGSKGYRWLEAETVKTLHKEDDIDLSYYDALVNAAVDDISKYGDFEWFTSDDPSSFDWYDDKNDIFNKR